MNSTLRPALLALTLAFAFGCSGNVDLKARKAYYTGTLEAPKAVLGAARQRIDFLAQALTRTSTPLAEPYATLGTLAQSMDGQAAELDATLHQGEAFEGDFDFFSLSRTVVGPDRPADLQAYKSLDGRFAPLGQELRRRSHALSDLVSRFDALAQTAHLARYERADLDAEAAKVADEADHWTHRMEERMAAAGRSIAFDEKSAIDPGVVAQRRNLLAEMNADLLKVEGLARRLIEDSGKLRVSWPQEQPQVWTGPGMADDGSALARFRHGADVFHRRAAEFKTLADTFDATQP
jgi:hypothetical protein